MRTGVPRELSPRKKVDAVTQGSGSQATWVLRHQSHTDEPYKYLPPTGLRLQVGNTQAAYDSKEMGGVGTQK